MAVVNKLTSKGQLTIPKKVSTEMGLQAGDLIRFEAEGSGAYRMTRYRCKVEAEGILHPFIATKSPAPTVADMNEAVSWHLAEKAATNFGKKSP